MDEVLHGILDRFYADKRNWKKNKGNKENAYSQAIMELREFFGQPCSVTDCSRTIQEINEYPSKLGKMVRVGLCRPHYKSLEFLNGENGTKTKN